MRLHYFVWPLVWTVLWGGLYLRSTGIARRSRIVGKALDVYAAAAVMMIGAGQGAVVFAIAVIVANFFEFMTRTHNAVASLLIAGAIIAFAGAAYASLIIRDQGEERIGASGALIALGLLFVGEVATELHGGPGLL